MAIPTVLAAMPDHATRGYKYTAAISYADGSIYSLCGAVNESSAMKIANGWLKARSKESWSDNLLRA